MNPQALHWTRSTQNGGRSHTRLAKKGATRAGLSRRISLSQITQLETSIISFVLPPSALAAAAAYRAASGETRLLVLAGWAACNAPVATQSPPGPVQHFD